MPNQPPKAGCNCFLYVNTGSFGSPVWLAIGTARDVKLPDAFTAPDASIRGDGGLAAVVLALRKIGLEFQVLWNTGATEFATLHPNYLAGTVTEFLALDGPVGSGSGSQGPRFTGYMTSFERNEPLEGSVVADVKVERNPGGTVSWFTA